MSMAFRKVFLTFDRETDPRFPILVKRIHGTEDGGTQIFSKYFFLFILVAIGVKYYYFLCCIDENTITALPPTSEPFVRFTRIGRRGSASRRSRKRVSNNVYSSEYQMDGSRAVLIFLPS